jgi:hypothetical protein
MGSVLAFLGLSLLRSLLVRTRRVRRRQVIITGPSLQEPPVQEISRKKKVLLLSSQVSIIGITSYELY